MTNINVYVAGHKGMVGSAIVRLLRKHKNINIIVKDKKDLDLTNQISVQNFFQNQKIDQIYLAAAKVGGILANSNYPAEFIYENLTIQTNVISAAFQNGIKKLLFLGSSCIYPKSTKQPMNEKDLLTGSLESTNEPYALAKIAGIKMCESFNRQYGPTQKIDYRSIMPTNLFGPGDKYDLEKSHVVPGLIRKFHEAKIKKAPKVIVWGTGMPRREFLHVDDLARACKHVMDTEKNIFYNHVSPMCSHINAGSGFDLTISELAKKIQKMINYNGEIEFDTDKPDGMRVKLLDSKKINDLGWKPKISLDQGLKSAYEDFLKNLN